MFLWFKFFFFDITCLSWEVFLGHLSFQFLGFVNHNIVVVNQLSLVVFN